MLGKRQHIPAVIADFPGMHGLPMISVSRRVGSCRVPVGCKALVRNFSKTQCQDSSVAFFFFFKTRPSDKCLLMFHSQGFFFCLTARKE